MIRCKGNIRRWIALGVFWIVVCLIVPMQANLCCPAHAEAQRELLVISLSAKPEELVAPEDVVLSFSIRNISDQDAQNVYLSSSDGLLSEPIGQIEAGETQIFNRQHSVTAEELQSGTITYIISHDDPTDPEAKVNYTVQAAIHQSDVLPKVEFTRQLSSHYVTAGNMVTITYRVRNTGNVQLNSLRVQDELGDFTGRIDKLEVGEVKSLISRVTISENCASKASLSYCVETKGDEVFTEMLSNANIELAEAEIDAVLTAGYTAFSANTADVVLLLTNNGNINYRDITVTDDLYGGVIADEIVVESGSEPVEISKRYPVRGTEGFRWRVSGINEAGDRFDFVTDTVSLTPVGEATLADLTLTAEAFTPRINRAGEVRIRLKIENGGNTDASKVVLSEAALGKIREFAVVPANGSLEREITVSVQENSQYSFQINYTDAEGWKRNVAAAPLEIVIAKDGALPENAENRFFEFTGLSFKLGGSSLFGVLLILAIVVLITLVVILLIASRRARLEKKLRIAAEKQRRKEEMGKTNRFTPIKRNIKKRDPKV